jgi:hypothetical protein
MLVNRRLQSTSHYHLLPGGCGEPSAGYHECPAARRIQTHAVVVRACEVPGVTCWHNPETGQTLHGPNRHNPAEVSRPVVIP